MHTNRFPRNLPVVGLLCLLLLGLGESDRRTVRQHNCRFWGGVADHMPGEIIAAHLSELPFSIENLSVGNHNGWSLIHYYGYVDGVLPWPMEPVVRRGQPAAHEDSLFSVAVSEAVSAQPKIAISHIRFCSSGLCDIPNPHPFTRFKNDKNWFFAHNGSIDIHILLDLIRPDYLAENLPENGDNPGEWIDSELYFLFLLQCFEDHDWRVERGLGSAIEALRLAIPGTSEMLNFVLTDCETMWGYREGISLFYLYEDEPVPYTVIASRYPSDTQGDWTEMQDGQLIIMHESYAPDVRDIHEYVDNYLIYDYDVDGLQIDDPTVTAHPNPFQALTTISFELPDQVAVNLRVFDLSGRLVRVLDAGSGVVANQYRVSWDGRNDFGQQMPSGTYFCRLEAGEHISLQRLSLLK